MVFKTLLGFGARVRARMSRTPLRFAYCARVAELLNKSLKVIATRDFRASRTHEQGEFGLGFRVQCYRIGQPLGRIWVKVGPILPTLGRTRVKVALPMRV